MRLPLRFDGGLFICIRRIWRRRSEEMTVQEYLDLERLAETRSEYYCGETFAMPGASIVHSGIVTNLLGELSHKLRKRPCVVCSSSLRLAIVANGYYTYPDVMVICGKPPLSTRMSTL